MEGNMTKQEQLRFVEELTANVLADLKKNVGRIPDHWDGHELRRWIADRFELSAAMSFGGPNRSAREKRRLREYRNTVLVENLL